MNDVQRQKITELRVQGQSYSQIALAVGVSENTVKTFSRRNNLKAEDILKAVRQREGTCECCGTIISIIEGRKPKRFCSSLCRNKWWNANLDKVNRKANYEYVCAYCQKPFIAYGNKKRKYCSHECYIADRFGGV